MDDTRREKVAANIMTTVASLLAGKIKDPRLGFITVTSVEVTGDLQHAKVFYTAYGTDEEKTASAAALESALAEARASDAELAARKGSKYAGEADPYKKPRETEADTL